MHVLVACEYSGAVRDSWQRRWPSHEVISCDLLPTDVPGPHYQGDVFDIIGDGWDIMLAHPPCTYLSSSGLHWNGRVVGRAEKTEAALQFVRALMAAPIHRIVIENPVGCIGTRIRPATQYIQPYNFGDDASKNTGLWLKNLPKLVGTEYIEPRLVVYKGKTVERWANQTDSGQNRLGPSKDRWKIRSETYPGIADAFAAQWGCEPQPDLFTGLGAA